jgi:hypothetical protein
MRSTRSIVLLGLVVFLGACASLMQGGHQGVRISSTPTNATVTGSKTIQGLTRGLGGGADSASMALGYQALISNTLGVNNLALGYQALKANTTGGNNVAVGYQTLMADTSGYANAAFGYQALQANTTGYANTAIGPTALLRNTTGYNNTALGVDALYTNTTGYSSTALGSNALGFGDGGNSNTAVGWRSSFNGGAGVANTSLGLTSLNANLTGQFNTAIGTSALFAALGSYNTAIGTCSLLNTTGRSNVALGFCAGAYETGSNAFYVDNQDRTNTIGDKAGALLYGTFNATPSLQTLEVNAALTVAQTLTVAAGEGTYAQGNVKEGGLAQQSGPAAGFNILTPSNNSTYYLLISGKDVADGSGPSNAFLDVIVFGSQAGWTHAVLSSTTVKGTPGARTYLNAAGNLRIVVGNGATWYIDVKLFKF